MVKNPAIRCLATGLLNVLAPCYCALCGMASQRNLNLCKACEAELPWIRSACRRCGIPLPSTALSCGQCLRKPPGFDLTLAPCLYTEPISGFIRAFKYHGDLSYLPVLTELMSGVVRLRLQLAPPPDLLVPMPMHWRRRWYRGFNQAAELAGGLCRHPTLSEWSLQVDARLCRRRRATAPQQKLDAEHRQRNLAGALHCNRQLDGQTIAIIDDVMTTGASANALVEVLRRSGAGSVELWCCARTPEPRQVGALVH